MARLIDLAETSGVLPQTGSEHGLVVDVVDPTRDSRWDAEAQRHPRANAFHSSSWARVLTKTYGHRPLYLRFSDGDHLIALLPMAEVTSIFRPRRGVSLPFSDFCDALVFESGRQADIFAGLVSFAHEQKWRYVELRGTGSVRPDARPAVSFYSHKLDLRGGWAEVTARFHPSVRRALRKSARAGLNVSIENTEQAMRAFFQLHEITRQRHGIPPQSLNFFLQTQREILERQMGFIVLVREGDKPVSAMVFFKWGRNAIYKFGASDKAYQRLRPNNLAMATGLEHLALTGAETLHFGRSSLPNSGLRRFKLAWGASEEMLHYYRYDAVADEWGITRDRTEGLHTELFRRLPLSINRLAGAMIYSQLD